MAIYDAQSGADERVEHVYSFVVTPRQKPERVDAFVTRMIQHATRSRVQKAIDQGTVTVNGAVTKANYKIRPNDVVQVVVMRQPPIALIPEDIPLHILYEDDHLLVIDKQAGLLTHPGVGNRSGTLVNAVLWHLGQREAIEVDLDDDGGDEDDEAASYDEHQVMSSSALRPGIVHRLDRDTTGVMVVGKSYEATMHLARQFHDRTVSREYVALVWGVVKQDHQTIEGNIGFSSRNRKLMAVVERGGKHAATDVTVTARFDLASLVRLKLHTGRTHQIRVHMSSIRHPVVGDAEYGGRETAVNGVHHMYRRVAQRVLACVQRQALHARTLGFTHPVTKERMSFESPIPADMQSAIDVLYAASEA
ncbi:MAG: RluA family pseudouridine synthase [Candidatus Kapabacteria bacterium]|nr:RluA family pseudouridine synthase [Candidatus Kapabacteria bacterium]